MVVASLVRDVAGGRGGGGGGGGVAEGSNPSAAARVLTAVTLRRRAELGLGAVVKHERMDGVLGKRKERERERRRGRRRRRQRRDEKSKFQPERQPKWLAFKPFGALAPQGTSLRASAPSSASRTSKAARRERLQSPKPAAFACFGAAIAD